MIEYDDYKFTLSAKSEQWYAPYIRDFDKFDKKFKGEFQSYNPEEYKKNFSGINNRLNRILTNQIQKIASLIFSVFIFHQTMNQINSFPKLMRCSN